MADPAFFKQSYCEKSRKGTAPINPKWKYY